MCCTCPAHTCWQLQTCIAPSPACFTKSMVLLIANAHMVNASGALPACLPALQDIHKPEPARLRRHLSALINFAKFREEKLVAYRCATAKQIGGQLIQPAAWQCAVEYTTGRMATPALESATVQADRCRAKLASSLAAGWPGGSKQPPCDTAGRVTTECGSQPCAGNRSRTTPRTAPYTGPYSV